MKTKQKNFYKLRNVIQQLCLSLNYYFSKKCDFSKKCEYYAKNSVTCNNGGGEHCGVWREKVMEQKT